jgi:hypothetical protein
MTAATSYADIILDWSSLIDATEKNPELMASVDTERQALMLSLREVEVIKSRQAELTALRQEATQQLTASLARGRELAIQIRSVIRGKVGPRSERLVHFKVAPIRRQPRKRLVVVKPPDEGTPGPAEPEFPAAKPVA